MNLDTILNRIEELELYIINFPVSVMTEIVKKELTYLNSLI